MTLKRRFLHAVTCVFCSPSLFFFLFAHFPLLLSLKCVYWRGCLPVYPSVCLSASLWVLVYIFIPLFIFLFIYLCICLLLHLPRYFIQQRFRNPAVIGLGNRVYLHGGGDGGCAGAGGGRAGGGGGE